MGNGVINCADIIEKKDNICKKFFTPLFFDEEICKINNKANINDDILSILSKLNPFKILRKLLIKLEFRIVLETKIKKIKYNINLIFFCLEKKDVINKIINKQFNGIPKINKGSWKFKSKKAVSELIKEAIKLLPVRKACLWIAISKNDPIITCKLDNINGIKMVKKTFICKSKKTFFLFRKKNKGIKKIKAKKSCTSELFNPIKNKKK